VALPFDELGIHTGLGRRWLRCRIAARG
jgi:hypothetical protein